MAGTRPAGRHLPGFSSWEAQGSHEFLPLPLELFHPNNGGRIPARWQALPKPGGFTGSCHHRLSTFAQVAVASAQPGGRLPDLGSSDCFGRTHRHGSGETTSAPVVRSNSFLTAEAIEAHALVFSLQRRPGHVPYCVSYVRCTSE